jgi:hypothetical protein
MLNKTVSHGAVRLILVFCAVATLGACSSMKTVEWTEEVLLSNGQKIVVKRANEYQRVMDVGAGFERGWNFTQARVEASLVIQGKDYRLIWQGLMSPLVLDIVSDNRAIILGVPTPYGVDLWRVPRHEFYVAFTFDNGDWRRIALADVPESVKPNLFTSTYQYFIEENNRSGVDISPSLKQRLDSNPLIGKRYRSIIRLPAPKTTK